MTVTKKLKKELNKIKRRYHYLKVLKQHSGCNRLNAARMLINAEKLNIRPQRYIDYECWHFTEEELHELGAALRLYDKKLATNKKWYINVLCEKTRCDEKEARAKFKIAKKKHYTYLRFLKSNKYALDLNSLKSIENYVHPEHEDSVADIMIRESIDRYKETIMHEMNWSAAKLKIEYLKANTNCGCTFHEFFVFGFYKKKPSEQKQFITTEIWVKLYLRYCDYSDSWKYFKEKQLFNEAFSKYISRDWCLTENITPDEFNHFISGKEEIIFKPLSAQCGIGITKYTIHHSKIEDNNIYDAISGKTGMIEDCIVQHKELARLNPFSINTIRVQTIVRNGQVFVLNAALRTGADCNSFTDNFASGGLVSAIDINTGIIQAGAVSKMGEVFYSHPVTGVTFKGFQIPNWSLVIETCRKAALEIETMPYIGWDAVVNYDGSVQLIEGNHDPGAVMHQYPWALIENKGIRSTVDEYIWFDEESRTI